MKMLKFNVDSQFITRVDTEFPVAKCRNVFHAHFDFVGEEWTGTKTALFVRENVAKAQILDGKNECIVPWEFFDTDKGTVGLVSVFCGDLMTANSAKVYIAKSGYVQSDASVPPTPDVYQQILDKINGMTGASPQEIEKAVNDYLAKNPVGIDPTLTSPTKGAPADIVGTLKEDFTKLDTSFNQHVNNHPSGGSGAVNPQDIEKAVNDYMVKNPVKVTETDPTVPQWAKEPTKPTYTASEVGALPSSTKIPTKLPNPQKLTFQGAVTAEYDGSGAVTVTIPSGGASGTVEIERIEKLATDTTVELAENKLYIFPEMASLTYSLKAPSKTNVANEYHFVFKSGATATQIVHPVGVKIGNFKVEPNKVYEVSIMENLLTSQSWAVV